MSKKTPISTTTETDEPVSTQAVKSPSTDRVIAILACLLSVVTLLVAGFLAYQLYTQYRPLLGEQSQWQSDEKQLADQLQQYQNSQSEQQQNLQQQLSTQQTHLSQLQATLHQGKQTWQLGRIGYLIKMAYDQAVFMHNADQAIALLTAANQAVSQARLPQWSNLSISLHQDINTLRAVVPVNVSDTFGQLNALDQQLSQLPLNTPHFQSHTLLRATDDQTHAKITQAAFWKAHLAQLWASLRSLMVIKHHDQSIVPIVDQQQQAYLRQNLHLILFQTKWALLYRDNTLYHSSLSQLSQWINDYFDQQSPVTKTALANINALEPLTLQAKLPAPKASLQALQAVESNNTQHTDTVALTPLTPVHAADTKNKSTGSEKPVTQTTQPIRSALEQRQPQSDQRTTNAPAKKTTTGNTVETIDS